MSGAVDRSEASLVRPGSGAAGGSAAGRSAAASTASATLPVAAPLPCGIGGPGRTRAARPNIVRAGCRARTLIRAGGGSRTLVATRRGAGLVATRGPPSVVAAAGATTPTGTASAESTVATAITASTATSTSAATRRGRGRSAPTAHPFRVNRRRMRGMIRHDRETESNRLLDVAQVADLLVAAERDGDTGATGATSTADSVHVALALVREIEVEDVGDAFDIDPA